MSEYRNYDDEWLLRSDNYCKHVSAMTGEKLHSKSDIAAELAYRDDRITELETQLKEREWVSVDDKVPESQEGKWSDPVIAMCDAGLIYKLSHFGSKDSGCWQRTMAFADNASKKVTHWMPLLKPTKEQDHE